MLLVKHFGSDIPGLPCLRNRTSLQLRLTRELHGLAPRGFAALCAQGVSSFPPTAAQLPYCSTSSPLWPVLVAWSRPSTQSSLSMFAQHGPVTVDHCSCSTRLRAMLCFQLDITLSTIQTCSEARHLCRRKIPVSIERRNALFGQVLLTLDHPNDSEWPLFSSPVAVHCPTRLRRLPAAQVVMTSSRKKSMSRCLPTTTSPHSELRTTRSVSGFSGPKAMTPVPLLHRHVVPPTFIHLANMSVSPAFSTTQ